MGNPRPNCVADDVSLTPASRSRQPRTNTRKCGDQPAHQSLLNRRLDGSVSGPAQSLYPAWPCSCIGIAYPRQGSLTTNIRVRSSSAPGGPASRRAPCSPCAGQRSGQTATGRPAPHLARGSASTASGCGKSTKSPRGPTPPPGPAWGGRHQLLQVALRMDPAQGVRGHPELTGIVGDHDGVVHQPVMPERPQVAASSSACSRGRSKMLIEHRNRCCHHSICEPNTWSGCVASRAITVASTDCARK